MPDIRPKITDTLPGFKDRILALIDEKTPPEFIKQRVGPDGRMVDYVEVGYVVDRLNEAFGRLWDFEILDQQVGNEQVWVKGQLKVWLAPNFAITKTQFGGVPIKRFARGDKAGQVMDIANDLKAAAADSLKKCASYLGIARDVYWGETEEQL